MSCFHRAFAPLTTDQVDTLFGLGCKFISSPHVDAEIIRRTKALGMLSVAGVATPSEAIQGLTAGADVLKFFPSSLATPNVVRCVLQSLAGWETHFTAIAAGGLTPADCAAFRRAGVHGMAFGIDCSTNDVSTAVETYKAFVRGWEGVPL
jgi:2-dehydro-3-deoxyphosphogalactonate aldolase